MSLGRFGHHPDPAIDFCVEVDALEGAVREVSIGLADKSDTDRRLTTALAFNVGGDAGAVAAKSKLREIAARFQ